jgi:TolA-binding protein
MSLSAMGDKGKACQTFGELAKRHPTAPAPVRQTLARERSAAACA